MKPYAVVSVVRREMLSLCGTSPLDVIDRTLYEYEDVASVVELQPDSCMHTHNALGECIPMYYRMGTGKATSLKHAIARATLAGLEILYPE